MKNQRKRSLMAVLLAVSILFTLPVWATSSARALDGEENYTLTINSGREAGDDIENAEVAIDLYKVANAVAVEGYDTYDYELLEAYSDLASDLEAARTVPEEQIGQENAGNNADAWMALANRAADIALEADEPVETVEMGAPASLKWGLYLVVARGENLLKTEYYKNENGKVVTIAQSPEIEYSFTPYLVSLPSTSEDLSGSMNTSDGNWAAAVRGNLKAEQEPRFGSLEIVKTLDSYNPAAGAAFVFQVEAVKDEEVVYSNVVSMNFAAAETQRYTLERIPAGAQVTVTEVYTGTAYEAVSDSEQTETIVAADTVSVEFENRYNGGGNNGGAILNHFAYSPADEETGAAGGWDWTQQ